MRKYAEILADIEQKRAIGVLRPGQKLPSVRQAADMYGCSISTVTRAYAELEKRHAIYSIPQSGYFSGKQFYLSDYLQREKFLRIGISRARPEQIDEGVKAVIEEVKRGMTTL